jgi:hypothetical protein
VTRRTARGIGVVDLLVGTALALAVLSVLTAAVGTGVRVLVAGSARGEAEDTAQLAVEAFTFDARRAGWDPRGAGIAALIEATPSRVTFTADLDGNGSVDATSEDTTAHACTTGIGRLSRIIGRQSLPLADGVSRCAFRYLDAAGAAIPVPPAGLAPAALAGVRAVALDLTLIPTGLRGRADRTVLVALRRAS